MVKNYPLKRIGRPDDVAPMIAFLASNDAAWITGQTISINGGFAML
jgi:2-hydroxycyclohexanecarboxyl-CoA dehydrogenase